MARETVLVVGATGMLGRQVVERLLARGKRVRALVRPTSKTDALHMDGVELAEGDLLDFDTLRGALEGAESLVTSAAGYTGHTPGDTIRTDQAGNRNLIDAAAASSIRRFVFTSILTCDLTPNVPHFWAKKVAEDHLEKRGVPFVSLRPGAFVDDFGRWGGDGLTSGRVTTIGDSRVPRTYVYTPDLADNLAAAVDADVATSERIDIGWDRALSPAELTRIAADILGRHLELVEMDLSEIRWPGMSDESFNDMVAMFDYFRTGRYVADTRRQAEVFGSVPMAEDAIRRMLVSRGFFPVVPASA
jgi:uncharacterized protein YbjT (DUF2867 family)